MSKSKTRTNKTSAKAKQTKRVDVTTLRIATDALKTAAIRAIQCGWKTGYTCTTEGAEAVRNYVDSLREMISHRQFQRVVNTCLVMRQELEKEVIAQYELNVSKFKSMNCDDEIAKITDSSKQHMLGVMDSVIGCMHWKRKEASVFGSSLKITVLHI